MGFVCEYIYLLIILLAECTECTVSPFLYMLNRLRILEVSVQTVLYVFLGWELVIMKLLNSVC